MFTSAGRPKSEARKCVAEIFVSIEDGGHKCTICRRILKPIEEQLSVKTAYNYFNEKRTENPKLSECARITLTVLPSPAIAERNFSKASASFMTESRKKLKISKLV